MKLALIMEDLKTYIHTYKPLILFKHLSNHARPPVTYAYNFDKTAIGHISQLTHVVREGVGQDSRHENDTIRFKQRFENYFAYDDGTSENGFGVEPIKNSNLSSRIFP
jgi:hypothetical protein